MSGSATVTAPTGPGDTVTAGVFTSLRTVTFDTIENVLTLTDTSGVIKTFDIKATATITATASSGVFTFTVSQ